MEQSVCASVRVDSCACCLLPLCFGSFEFCVPRVSDSNASLLGRLGVCNGLREFVRPGAHLCLVVSEFSEFAIFFVNSFVQGLEQLAMEDVVVKSDAIIKVSRFVWRTLRQQNVWP